MINCDLSDQVLAELTVHEASTLLEQGLVSSVRLTQLMLDRIEQSQHNAFITINPRALELAEASDQRRAKGESRGSLDGIPMALKDNILTQDLRTTCASRMLENFIPPYSATVARRLADAGCILLGKLNMDEFAMGSTNETSYFGPVLNPRDPQRIPGGSSGGSAAAVAAHLAYFALGTDTGGSIRQPAAMCGVVGLKPTYGRVSRFGVVAFASSLDQVGPVTKDVRDATLVLKVIAGQDKYDGSSLPNSVPDYQEALPAVDQQADLQGLRVGIPVEYMGEGINPEVRGAIEKLAGRLAEQGAVVESCSLPRLDYALSAYYVISSAEACSNLGRYDGIKYGYRAKSYESINELIEKSRSEGFGDEVKRRILLGTYTLSAGYFDAYYKRAQQVRTLIMEDFRQAFSKYDILLTPTSPVTAWPLGQAHENPLEVYAMDICTVSVNVAGLPSISVPCGQDGSGLPIGAQVIANTLNESVLLRSAEAIRQITSGGQA